MSGKSSPFWFPTSLGESLNFFPGETWGNTMTDVGRWGNHAGRLGGLGKVEHSLGLMERWTGVHELSTVTALLLR